MNAVMKSLPLALISTLMLFTPAAKASGDGDLWIGPVAMFCIAQTPSLLDTTYAKMFFVPPPPEYVAWKKKMAGPLACLAQRHPLSDDLCSELFSQTAEKPADLTNLYNKYASNIQGLQSHMEACESELKTQPSSNAGPVKP